jgi:hypothetical protein
MTLDEVRSIAGPPQRMWPMRWRGERHLCWFYRVTPKRGTNINGRVVCFANGRVARLITSVHLADANARYASPNCGKAVINDYWQDHAIDLTYPPGCYAQASRLLEPINRETGQEVELRAELHSRLRETRERSSQPQPESRLAPSAMRGGAQLPAKQVDDCFWSSARILQLRGDVLRGELALLFGFLRDVLAYAVVASRHRAGRGVTSLRLRFGGTERGF